MRVFEPGDTHLVVVGVDGSPESLEAARFGAAEAAARDLGLLVVHACQTGRARDASATEARRADGCALVEELLAQVRMAPTTQVSTIVEVAPVAELLRALTGDAALLVLGQHHFRLADGHLAGQVAPAVGANARCPVVVVPAGWTRTVARNAHLTARPVVAGVGGSGPATSVLQVAYDEAELRRVPVQILHASTGADVSAARRAATERDVAEIVAAQHEDHPDVAIDYRFVPAATILTWVEASSGATLMVLGRPASLHRRLSWKHSVAHAMLDQAHCPLMVVPLTARPAAAADRPRAGATILP